VIIGLLHPPNGAHAGLPVCSWSPTRFPRLTCQRLTSSTGPKTPAASMQFPVRTMVLKARSCAATRRVLGSSACAWSPLGAAVAECEVEREGDDSGTPYACGVARFREKSRGHIRGTAPHRQGPVAPENQRIVSSNKANVARLRQRVTKSLSQMRRLTIAPRCLTSEVPLRCRVNQPRPKC
jgi:hypothetical protein